MAHQQSTMTELDDKEAADVLAKIAKVAGVSTDGARAVVISMVNNKTTVRVDYGD